MASTTHSKRSNLNSNSFDSINVWVQFIKWIYRESVHLSIFKWTNTKIQQQQESGFCSFLYGERHLFVQQSDESTTPRRIHVPCESLLQPKLRHPREVGEIAKLQTISFFISVDCSAYVQCAYVVQIPLPMLASILRVFVFSCTSREITLSVWIQRDTG